MPDPIPRFTGASSDPAVEAQLKAVLDRLYGLYHTDIDLRLNRTFRFLEKLGSPQERLPPVVHIAGTNGKGSTTATLRALFEASGHAVHAYTSPHLVHPTERVLLAGVPVTSEAFLDVLNECIEINQNDPITFFEITTCAAILLFSRVHADILLLETGMGGRLDATNVIQRPAATVITTISHDHQAFLGNTLPKIAFEKAGIMKPGVPCVVGYQLPEAIAAGVPDVFLKASQALSPEAPLARFGAEWASAPEGGRMLFRYGSDSILLPKPCLLGNHQIWNAGAALAAFRLIAPDHFKPEILSTAMERIVWPGRLQTLKNHAFTKRIPAGWELVIDGGHNDSGGHVLGLQMKDWGENDPRPLHLVVAMMDRKDAAAFLRPLVRYATSITLTGITGEGGAYAPETLAAIARELGFRNISTAPDAATALEAVVRAADVRPPARVLMTGSLYFVGSILAV
jgi:dihydrofolate synthase / folylpolyglutamate synthase